MMTSSTRASSMGGEDDGEEGDDDVLPLFVNVIDDLMYYRQFRGLFAQHGRLQNVFLQMLRKQGRKFRFGFVRFFSRKDASLVLLAFEWHRARRC